MFKNLIRQAVKAKGLTVVAFSRATRISRSYIYRIIKGKCPSLKLAMRIARVLGLSIEELFPLFMRLKAKVNAKLIRKLMTKSGYTQNELARKIGISTGTLSNILAGRRMVGKKTLSGLQRLFSVEIIGI